MAKAKIHKELLDDEWYHVRHSGEIPEVALHSSIHYLTEDCDGPRLVLDEEDHKLLISAALERYREIIIRDITPTNRDASIYRGILRTIANWRRLKRFSRRHCVELDALQSELTLRLQQFLENEIEEVRGGLRSSSINCTFEDIQAFAVELGVSLNELEAELRRICLHF